MKHTINRKVFLYILLLIIVLIFCNVKSQVNKALEQAYFEGQKDALENDIRIKINENNRWIWIKSPWVDGRQPVFIPPFNCCQDNN